MSNTAQPREIEDRSFSGIRIFRSNPDVQPIVRAERYAVIKLHHLATMIGRSALSYFSEKDLIKNVPKK